MGEYLLLITIGPVQEFIASARRSRDLWLGSWLLSDLAREVAHAIALREGFDRLIFPAPAGVEALAPGGDPGVPNKILARVSTDPAQLEPELRALAGARLRALGEQALAQVSGPFALDAALAQITELLEWYWAALPLPAGADYPAVRARLEALGSARKLTRDFARVSSAAPVPKSSIDGQRESVIPDEQFDRLTPDQLFRLYGARRAERLSGVDLLKRHGHAGGESRFPSTSHMAAAPLLARMAQPPAGTDAGEDRVARRRDAWRAYLDALKAAGAEPESLPGRMPSHPVIGRWEGSALFAERLAEDVADRAGLSELQRALRAFLSAAADGRAPNPYYAILHADGDHMGKVIDNQPTPERHRAVSAALDAFAATVRREVAAAGGALVYAGGDDVLAFLPLHTALDCGATLARAFREQLAAFTATSGRSPTLSAGLLLTHHLEPLGEALNLVRAAERHAKALDEAKDALAVTVSKRSGSDTSVRDRWGRLDVRLKLFARLHVADALPDGAAYDLRSLAGRLAVAPTHDDFATLDRAQRREARRILARKQAEHGQVALRGRADADLQQLYAWVEDPALSIRQIADELVIAREFARGLEQAGETGA